MQPLERALQRTSAILRRSPSLRLRETFACGGLLRDDGPEDVSYLRGVPFRGADHTADFLSGAIDDERRRQADGAERPQRLAGYVDVHREIAHADLGIKVADLRDSAAIDGN